VLRVLIGLVVIAGVIAFVVSRMADEGISNGPTQIQVDTPNPLGGGDGGNDGGIYVP
jgi:hypothetical protein